PSSIAERASVVGIAPELVYTTEVDGYDLAPQSVGPGAAEGMSATWVDESTGAMLTIRTDRGELTAASCAETPLWDAPDEPVTCTDEEGVWHRSGGAIHEYIAVRDGALIRVTGMSDASPEELLAAAKAVHVPSEAELALLFSDLPEVAPEPVERGDLPENGDGAPIDPVGPGG
ncbi:MAG: rane protein, partial [Microbacterium sp.]|nr:rane protein [Microbacterium sp.]